MKSAFTDAALKRIASAVDNGLPEFLYHVTFYKNLPDIEENGLQVIGGSGIGQGAGYSQHSGKGVFVTEFDGVSFWFSRSEQWGESMSDDVYEDGLFPVVLAVSHELEGATTDEIGGRDSSSNSWIIDPVGPDALWVWNGKAWAEIENWDSINVDKAFDVETVEQGEDEENEAEGGEDDYEEKEEEVIRYFNEYLLPTEEVL